MTVPYLSTHDHESSVLREDSLFIILKKKHFRDVLNFIII